MFNTILVTGGAGFIGSNFLYFLKNVTDDRIIVLDNITYAGKETNIPDGVEFIWCDISDKEHVDYIFEKVKPTKVFNFAAESHVDNSIRDVTPFIKTNIIGTTNLLSSSVAVGVEKFHHVSTSSSNNYGPRQHPEKLIPKIILNGMNDTVTNMYGGGHQVRDWIHVLDHCTAIWSLEEKKVINDKFNIGGACEVTNMDITKKILDILDKPHSLIGQSDERPGQDQRYGTDFSKLTEKTGWFPGVEFNRGLAETVKWYLD